MGRGWAGKGRGEKESFIRSPPPPTTSYFTDSLVVPFPSRAVKYTPATQAKWLASTIPRVARKLVGHWRFSNLFFTKFLYIFSWIFYKLQGTKHRKKLETYLTDGLLYFLHEKKRKKKTASEATKTSAREEGCIWTIQRGFCGVVAVSAGLIWKKSETKLCLQ